MIRTTPGSTAPSVQFDAEVTRSIRQHARSHMKTEVCGVLIGENRDGAVEVQASIEALGATQAGTHVTFTQDAWEAIYRIKDESYPQKRIVGWYHSHPGFGVFLSEHDTFIHRNFFSSPYQVAWVYDPHTDEEGCFGWIDGDIHRVPSFSILDNGSDGVESTPKDVELTTETGDEPSVIVRGAHKLVAKNGDLRGSMKVLWYLSALLLGFALSYFFFPRLLVIPVDPITGEPEWQSIRPAGSAPRQPSSNGNHPSAQSPGTAIGQPVPDPNAKRNK